MLFETYRDLNIQVLEDQDRRRLYHAQASLQRQMEPELTMDGLAEAAGRGGVNEGQVGRHRSNASVSQRLVHRTSHRLMSTHPGDADAGCSRSAACGDSSVGEGAGRAIRPGSSGRLSHRRRTELPLSR